MAATSETAADLLSMLEERLARIDYVVNGNQQDQIEVQSTSPAKTRLRALVHTLDALTARSTAAAQLIQLQKQHPQIFHAQVDQAAPTSLPPASLAQLVLAHEQTYKNAASQLTILNDNKDISDASSLIKLVEMQPRIEEVEARQKRQAQEFAELRARSARLLDTWYERGVLDMGEYWAQCEERLRDCEILVRRKEAAKRREDGMV